MSVNAFIFQKSYRKSLNQFCQYFQSKIQFQIIICMRNLNDSQIQSGWGISDQNLDEKEKNEQFEHPSIDERPRLPIKLQNSPHIDKYNYFFRNIKHESKQILIQRLQSQGITYDNSLNNQTATINQLKSSLNFETIFLEVRLGPFYIPITILNRSDRSPFHVCETIGRGAAGQIFQATCNNHIFAIKCVKCSDYSSRKSPLLAAIQQYAMFKICSALQVGPKLKQYMGFDIVCYTECIEFSMQKCTKIERCGKAEQNKIKQCLKLMHLLQIAHFDIKPANINYSPSCSKPIFLDFGFSRALSIPIGKMRPMVFIGTVGYCSEEMNEAYFSQEQKYIDPFYNDVVGLQRSLVVLKKQKGLINSLQVHAQSYFQNFSELSNKRAIDSDNESEKSIEESKIRSSSHLKQFQSSSSRYVQEELLYYNILFLIFTSQYEYITLSHRQQQILPNFINKIISFINSLSPSSQIKAFQEKYIKRKSFFNDKINHSFLKLSNFSITDDRKFVARLSPLLNYEINLNDFRNKRGNNDFSGNKQRLIEGKQEFVSQQDYLLTLLEYIRFNHLNQSADKKSKQQVCRAHLEIQSNEIYSFRQIIQKTFLSLMEYCLKSDFNACTRYLFSHVFEHICMLNIMTLKQIHKIIIRISLTSFSLYAKVFFFIEIDRGLVWKERSMQIQKQDGYLSTLHLKSLLFNSTTELIQTNPDLDETSKVRILKYLPKYFYLKQINFYTAKNHFREFFEIMSILAGRSLTKAEKNWLSISSKARQCENLMMRDAIQTRNSLFQLQKNLSSNNHSYIQTYHIIIAEYQYISYKEVFVAQFTKILELKLGEYYQIYDFRLKMLNMRSKRSLIEQKYYVQNLISTLQHIQKAKTISNHLYRQAMKCFLAISSSNTQLQLVKPLQNAIDRNQINFLTSISWILCYNSELLDNCRETLLKLYLNYHMARKNNLKNYSILKIINKYSETIPAQISKLDAVKMLYSCNNLKKVLLWLLALVYFQAEDYQMVEKIHLKSINLEQNNSEYTRLKKYLMLVFMLQNCKQKRNKYAYEIYSCFNREMTVSYLFYHSVKIFVYILDYIIEQRMNKEQEIVQLFLLLSGNLEIFYHKNKVKIYTYLIQYFVSIAHLTSSIQISVNIFNILFTKLQKHPYLSLLIIKLGDKEKIIRKENSALAKGLSKISNQARELVINIYLRNIIQSDCSLRKQKVFNIRCNKKDALKKNTKMMKNIYCDRRKKYQKQAIRNKLKNYFRNYNNHNIVHFSNENPMFTEDI